MPSRCALLLRSAGSTRSRPPHRPFPWDDSEIPGDLDLFAPYSASAASCAVGNSADLLAQRDAIFCRFSTNEMVHFGASRYPRDCRESGKVIDVLAVLAPGQGSQKPGFLTPWLTLPGAEARLRWWSALAGVDLVRLGTEADANEIKDTAKTQPLLVAAAPLTAEHLPMADAGVRAGPSL